MSMRSLAKALLRVKFVRFFLAGSVSTALYYAVFIPLVEWHAVQYELGATIAFMPSFVVNFALQKYWAFEECGRREAKRQLVKFSLKNFLFLCVNLVLLYVGVEHLRFTPLVAQAVVTSVLTAFAYLIYDRWIFRAQPSAA